MRMSYVNWFSMNEKTPIKNEIVLIKCDIFDDITIGIYDGNSWTLSEVELRREFDNFPIDFKVEYWAEFPKFN